MPLLFLVVLERVGPGPAQAGSFLVRWLRARTPAGEPFLGNPDIQSLNDLAGSFDVIRRMRIVAFDKGLVLILLAATLAPMVPLVFLVYAVATLLELAAKVIIGL